MRRTCTLVWLVVSSGLGCRTAQPTSESEAALAAAPAHLPSRWLMDWAEPGRKAWYLTPQGSFMAPMAVFLALKTQEGDRPFAARANLEPMGWTYPPDTDADAYSVHGLPLGFSEEANAEMHGVPSAGLSCAACHTGQLTYRGTRYVVDGGQTMANVEAFTRELAAALTATNRDPQRIATLQADIAKAEPTSIYAHNAQQLRDDLNTAATYMQGRLDRSKPAVTYGHGRIDAFGEIMNEVLVDEAGLKQKRPNGQYVNAEYPAAPVSVPYLWTAPDLECLQTNCISRNPLTRNLGESLGVFGRAKIRIFKDAVPTAKELFDAKDLFTTTADLNKLYQLEAALIHLPPPKWPEAEFGALDQQLVKRGAALYNAKSYSVGSSQQSCASCHVLADWEQADSVTAPNAMGGRFFKVTRWGPEVTKTDTAFINQALSRKVVGLPIGLQALYDLIVKKGEPVLERFAPGEETLGVKFLSVGTTLAVRRFFLEQGFNDQQKAEYLHKHENAPSFEPSVYKARPLNGIAFTAPYLHNGSVPTLEDLFKRPQDRPKIFAMGTLSWDAQSIGYVHSDAQSYEFGRFTFDTSGQANANTGHEWGTELAEADKQALIEYLKSL